MDDLEELELQLVEVESKLKVDPSDAELMELRKELVEIIELQKEVLYEEKHVLEEEKYVWKVGDRCRAVWSEDSKCYPAVITKIEDEFCIVKFVKYLNTQRMPLDELQKDERALEFLEEEVPAISKREREQEDETKFDEAKRVKLEEMQRQKEEEERKWRNIKEGLDEYTGKEEKDEQKKKMVAQGVYDLIKQEGPSNPAWYNNGSISVDRLKRYLNDKHRDLYKEVCFQYPKFTQLFQSNPFHFRVLGREAGSGEKSHKFVIALNEVKRDVSLNQTKGAELLRKMGFKDEGLDRLDRILPKNVKVLGMQQKSTAKEDEKLEDGLLKVLMSEIRAHLKDEKETVTQMLNRVSKGALDMLLSLCEKCFEKYPNIYTFKYAQFP